MYCKQDGILKVGRVILYKFNLNILRLRKISKLSCERRPFSYYEIVFFIGVRYIFCEAMDIKGVKSGVKMSLPMGELTLPMGDSARQWAKLRLRLYTQLSHIK